MVEKGAGEPRLLGGDHVHLPRASGDRLGDALLSPFIINASIHSFSMQCIQHTINTQRTEKERALSGGVIGVVFLIHPLIHSCIQHSTKQSTPEKKSRLGGAVEYYFCLDEGGFPYSKNFLRNILRKGCLHCWYILPKEEPASNPMPPLSPV